MTDYTIDPGATIDRLIAERDAALGREATLREDLEGAEADIETIADHNIHLQQRLTAADERADVLEGLLRRAKPYIPWKKFGTVQYQWNLEAQAALKQAEGGGDEAGRISLSDKALSLIDEEIRIKGLPS